MTGISNLSVPGQLIKAIFRLFVFIVLLLGVDLSAQDPGPGLKLSYYGNNLWNPGILAGLEYSRKSQHFVNRSDKSFTKEKGYTLDLGFYIDPGSYSGFHASAGAYRRIEKENGAFFQLGASPFGIFRSFLPEAYEFSGEGEISKVILPGRSYYAPGGSIGFGKAFKKAPSTRWYMDLNLTGLIPYNTYFMLLVNTEIGLIVCLK